VVFSVTGFLYNCYVYILVSVLRAADCYSEYEDWMHNMVFFVNSTNLEVASLFPYSYAESLDRPNLSPHELRLNSS
jgi:hypothetical protein